MYLLYYVSVRRGVMAAVTGERTWENEQYDVTTMRGVEKRGMATAGCNGGRQGSVENEKEKKEKTLHPLLRRACGGRGRGRMVIIFIVVTRVYIVR